MVDAVRGNDALDGASVATGRVIEADAAVDAMDSGSQRYTITTRDSRHSVDDTPFGPEQQSVETTGPSRHTPEAPTQKRQTPGVYTVSSDE